jgi:hypothetical protein
MVPFALFICLLVAHIALLTAGVAGRGVVAGAVVQASGQKVIVFAAIMMVIVQAVQLRTSVTTSASKS